MKDITAEYATDLASFSSQKKIDEQYSRITHAILKSAKSGEFNVLYRDTINIERSTVSLLTEKGFNCTYHAGESLIEISWEKKKEKSK